MAMCLNEAMALFASCEDSTNGTEKKAVAEIKAEAEQAPLVTPDLTFFQLHGPVKKMTMYENTYEFDENGNLTKVNGESASDYYYRDSKGRISSEEIEIHTEYYWDSESPIGCNVRMIGDISYTYDDKGFIVKEEGGMGNFTYTYDRIDEFGNWVSRKSDNGETLVRKIEYYNASSSTAAGNKDLSEENTIKITNKSVGQFTVGTAFPKSGQVPQSDLTIKQESHTEIGEGDDYTVVVDIVMSGKDKVMELYKGVSNNNIDEIMVYSSKAKTTEGIGVNSTLEEFFNAYNNASLGYSPYSSHGMIILECTKYENCQFLLPMSYLKQEPDVQGDWIELKPSDFKSGAKIEKVRVF